MGAGFLRLDLLLVCLLEGTDSLGFALLLLEVDCVVGFSFAAAAAGFAGGAGLATSTPITAFSFGLVFSASGTAVDFFFAAAFFLGLATGRNPGRCLRFALADGGTNDTGVLLVGAILVAVLITKRRTSDAVACKEKVVRIGWRYVNSNNSKLIAHSQSNA